MAEEIDSLDIKILDVLKSDARMPYTELAKKLDMSDVAIKKRVDRLVGQGIIKKFSIDVDHKKLGKKLHAFLLLRASPAEFENIRSGVGASENTLKVLPVLGSFDLLIEVACRDMDELRAVSEEEIGNMKGVVEIRTLIVV